MSSHFVANTPSNHFDREGVSGVKLMQMNQHTGSKGWRMQSNPCSQNAGTPSSSKHGKTSCWKLLSFIGGGGSVTQSSTGNWKLIKRAKKAVSSVHWTVLCFLCFCKGYMRGWPCPLQSPRSSWYIWKKQLCWSFTQGLTIIGDRCWMVACSACHVIGD